MDKILLMETFKNFLLIKLNCYYFFFNSCFEFSWKLFHYCFCGHGVCDLDFCHCSMIGPLILFMYKISRETKNSSCIHTKHREELELILKHISHYHTTYVNKWVPFNGSLQHEPALVTSIPVGQALVCGCFWRSLILPQLQLFLNSHYPYC